LRAESKDDQYAIDGIRGPTYGTEIDTSYNREKANTLA